MNENIFIIQFFNLTKLSFFWNIQALKKKGKKENNEQKK